VPALATVWAVLIKSQQRGSYCFQCYKLKPCKHHCATESRSV